MKKSTMAVAALLTALSSAPMVSVAYADDAAPTSTSTCAGCKAADCKDAADKAACCKAACCKATGDEKVACCKAASCKAATDSGTDE